ncbi:MAG TPA: DUF5684 domain-containing protein [Anaerolineaceae bacterium]|nr:DUF5684 domain-containing protein [Anaerolineaceae bacterium]
MNSDYGIGFFGSFVFWVFYIAIIVFYIICMWKIFVKAGKPGWASIIPIYSSLVQLEILGRPWWWLLLLFVPLVNIVISIMIIFDMAKVFGKDTGFGFGLLFLSFIFIPILAFGDAQYLGPIAGETYQPPMPPVPPSTPPTI